MLDADVTMNKITEFREYKSDGTMVPWLRVEFMVGKHGPFVEKFLKDGYTADTRDLALNAFAREVR